MQLIIYGEYDRHGYDVMVRKPDGEVLEEYWHGNHKLDSCQFAELDSPFAESEETIKQYCEQALEESKADYEKKGYSVVVELIRKEEEPE